jgi:hypothetical protein
MSISPHFDYYVEVNPSISNHSICLLLLCDSASGEKYVKGNEWNVKVVNHFWLEDCYLSWCMQSETKPRYGLFPPNSQLTEVFGTGLSPELIEEWTSPGIYEDVNTQPNANEAGGEANAANNDPAAPATQLLLEGMATGDDEHHSKQLEQEQPEKEQHRAVSRSTRQSSATPTPMEGVEAHQSTPSPRKATPRRGSKSAGVTAMEPSSLSSHTDSDLAMPGSHSPGGVRIVSRKRGAALEATKALQQIVPDMNEFQEELRDEKRRKKRGKTAPIDEPREGDDSMDVDADEPERQANSRKTPTSPIKRKRVSMGSAGEPNTPVKSQEDTGNESEDAVAAGQKTPVKKSRRATKAEREREASIAATEATATATETSEATSPGSVSKFKHARYISTGLTKEPSAKQVKALKALGIVSTTAVDQCTHLVAKNVGRTEKFLTALAQGKIIVHEDWLQACIDASAILGKLLFSFYCVDLSSFFFCHKLISYIQHVTNRRERLPDQGSRE